MSRDYKVYLEDILAAIEKVRRYTGGLDLDGLVQDDKTLDAVLRNLGVIGEAAKRVPDDVRSRHPQIEWKRIAGLRDILIRDYFGIDHEIIWDVVQNKLPKLKQQIREIINA